MTIDPMNITKYDRSDAELERFWTFCVLVAGKNADWAAIKVNDLYASAERQGMTPFAYLRENRHALHNILVANRVGQYHRIEKALEASLELDLRTCTIAELEAIFGIGPKTARFFVLHTRRDAQCAVLDTHVLRWMTRTLGPSFDRHEIPSSTPPPRVYLRLEQLCLALIRATFPGMTLAEADLLIWCLESGRLSGDIEAKYSELPAVPRQESPVE